MVIFFMQIYLQAVAGTGPDGQIRADDVMTFTPAPSVVSTPVSVAGAPGAYVDIPLTSMRKVLYVLS